MDRDPLDLPTSPSVPSLPVKPPQSPWPDQTGGRPPRGRSPWPLLAALGAGLAVTLIVALLLTLMLSARGGATTVLLGAAEQTSTSAQATSTAEGTPPISLTGTAGPRSTATPGTPRPAAHIVSVQASGNSTYSVDVRCPGEELALSGGWKSDANTPVVGSGRLSVNGGFSANGWDVSAPSSSGAFVTSYALCLLHAAGASVTERSTDVDLTYGAASTVVATCTPDEVLVGGGFLVRSGSVDVTHFSPTADHSGFSVTGVIHTSVAQGATTYHPPTLAVRAECLSGVKAHLTVPSPVQQNISAHGGGAVQITCPQGMVLSGGGIDLLNGVAVAYDFSPSSATTWRAQVQNQTIVSTTVRLYALCLSFS